MKWPLDLENGTQGQIQGLPNWNLWTTSYGCPIVTMYLLCMVYKLQAIWVGDMAILPWLALKVNFKVINRRPMYDFLLVANSICAHIVNGLWVTSVCMSTHKLIGINQWK